MGSKNPKTSYSQKYFFFLSNYTIKSIFFGVSPPPPPSKLEIFQPLDQ